VDAARQGPRVIWRGALLLAVAMMGQPAEIFAKELRSGAARSEFVRNNPCPATSQAKAPCPGYVVDHVVPLCAGGPDIPSNMQWQAVAEAKIKDREEIKSMRTEEEMESSTSTLPTGRPLNRPGQTRPWPETWLKKSWVRELHKRLSIIYLTAFTASFADDEAIEDWCEVWAEHLAGLTGDQLSYGIKAVAARGTQWPPTMGEFRSFCLIAPIPNVPRIEPPKVVMTEAGAQQMARVKEIVSHVRPAGTWWATRIMEKVERGEPVIPIAVEFARIALHNGNAEDFA